MTHYAALSEVVTRKAGSEGRTLTFRWSDTPVRDLIEHLDEGGELDTFLEAQSSVKRYHARLTRDIWHDVEPEADIQRDAWRQLRQQADWALVSEAVSRRIEEEPVALSDPPTESQFVSLVRQATAEIGVGSNAARTAESSDGSPRDCWERGDAQPSASPSVSDRSVDLLTEAAIRLDNAVDQLARAGHPALSAYAQLLTNRLDDIVAEL